jgi:hypothetical protein
MGAVAVSESSWPQAFVIGAASFQQTAVYDHADAIIVPSSGGPRADYDIFVGGDFCGWLKCQHASDDRGHLHLNIRMLLEKETSAWSLEMLQGTGGGAFQSAIVDAVMQGKPWSRYHMEIAGIDILYYGMSE